jgi:hypothetical protein
MQRTDLPERLQYTKYYEHDGMLRAYANRAMVMAFLFAGIAVASLAFAIYVRVQPPTVIRVVLTASVRPSAAPQRLPLLRPRRWAGADSLEARALVGFELSRLYPRNRRSEFRGFPEHDDCQPSSYTLGKLRDDDTVEDQTDRITSQLKIRTMIREGHSLDVYRVRRKGVHRVRDRVESTDRLVSRYNIRLLQDRRTESVPATSRSRVLEQQMVSERRRLLQQSKIQNRNEERIGRGRGFDHRRKRCRKHLCSWASRQASNITAFDCRRPAAFLSQ